MIPSCDNLSNASRFQFQLQCCILEPASLTASHEYACVLQQEAASRVRLGRVTRQCTLSHKHSIVYRRVLLQMEVVGTMPLSDRQHSFPPRLRSQECLPEPRWPELDPMFMRRRGTDQGQNLARE